MSLRLATHLQKLVVTTRTDHGTSAGRAIVFMANNSSMTLVVTRSSQCHTLTTFYLKVFIHKHTL
eukprot:COSAG01_NODE_3299_length_6296_cov_243.565112_3_plen_65_part_00